MVVAGMGLRLLERGIGFYHGHGEIPCCSNAGECRTASCIIIPWVGDSFWGAAVLLIASVTFGWLDGNVANLCKPDSAEHQEHYA